MHIQRHGIILNVENFETCVDFYHTLFELPVLFSKEEGDFKLACLEFGDGYLMIETEGVASPIEKTMEQGAAKLRFNVANIEQALIAVKAYDPNATILSTPWGSTINITDPDGNRVGIRDEAGFITDLAK